MEDKIDGLIAAAPCDVLLADPSGVAVCASADVAAAARSRPQIAQDMARTLRRGGFEGR